MRVRWEVCGFVGILRVLWGFLGVFIDFLGFRGLLVDAEGFLRDSLGIFWGVLWGF